MNKNKYTGAQYIKYHKDAFPISPGVYKMYNQNNNIIYIGKAKVLKNRLLSYANAVHSIRIHKMVESIHKIEYIVTNTETEALILEAELIKLIKPKFNILLRDDKTFPFIAIDSSHDFPRMHKVRIQPQSMNSNTFGPYVSTEVIDETIALAQQLFKVRVCSDNVFHNRKQPCLYYQIHKCSAPCVNKISKQQYQSDIQQVYDFLNLKNHSLREHLIKNMENASNDKNYELAIKYRDKLKILNNIQAKQSITLKKPYNIDFINIAQHHDTYCVQIFAFRYGRPRGNYTEYFAPQLEQDMQEILYTFILQYYTQSIMLPDSIISPFLPNEHELLENMFKVKFNKKVTISVKNQYNDILDIIHKNTVLALYDYYNTKTKWQQHFIDLAKLVGCEDLDHIESFDNSHLNATHTLGVMVYVNKEKFVKSKYKRFNKKDTQSDGADDIAMMHEVITRRIKSINTQKLEAPILMLIDGGKAQVNAVYSIIKNNQLQDYIKILGVAKGKNRNAGEETLITHDLSQIKLSKSSKLLHFIQLIRDNTHRFAITSMRSSKVKELTNSSLDKIPGVGKVLKKQLLKHFTSVEVIKSLQVSDLMQVEGVSKVKAKVIYEWFNNI